MYFIILFLPLIIVYAMNILFGSRSALFAFQIAQKYIIAAKHLIGRVSAGEIGSRLGIVSKIGYFRIYECVVDFSKGRET